MSGDVVAILASMTVAGLASSLHCLGMCGPLLTSLDAGVRRGRFFPRGMAAYHLGRLWSYALLGLLAGAFGSGLRWAIAGRRWTALVLGIAILVDGLVLLTPTGKTTRPFTTPFAVGLRRILAWSGLQARTGFGPRFLVGALMGWIPCGLLYAMVIPAAALPSPPWSALAMVAFGLGTIPALVAVSTAHRWATPAIRRRGRAAVAVMLLIAGLWMMGRSIRSSPTSPGCLQHAASASVGTPRLVAVE